MKQPLDHGDMVANILAYWDSASPEQRAAGAHWYPIAGRLASLIAHETGIAVDRVATAIAALSPRNPWRWNIADAYAFASAKAEGRTMPTATTFVRNRLAAWRALGAEEPWRTAAPKVRAFVRAILGDCSAVVVDTWAAKVATAGKLANKHGSTLSERQYAAIAEAYREAAELRSVSPVTMQAVTWLVAQTEGLATARRSRHDLSFKSGTPAFLVAAML